MNLAEKLVILRKQKGLTQLDLAEKLSVSRQAISRWEVGSAVPNTDNLRVLAELYGVTLDYLLNEDIVRLCEQVEDKEKNQNVGRRKKWRIWILACVILVSIILGVIIGVMSTLCQNQEQPIPLGNMSQTDEDDMSTVTFSFD